MEPYYIIQTILIFVLVVVTTYYAIQTHLQANLLKNQIEATTRLETQRREYESKQRLLDDLIIMTREIVRLFPNSPPTNRDEIVNITNLLGSIAAFMETVKIVKYKLGKDVESRINVTGLILEKYFDALDFKNLKPTLKEQKIIDDTHVDLQIALFRLIVDLTTCRLQL